MKVRNRMRSWAIEGQTCHLNLSRFSMDGRKVAREWKNRRRIELYLFDCNGKRTCDGLITMASEPVLDVMIRKL